MSCLVPFRKTIRAVSQLKVYQPRDTCIIKALGIDRHFLPFEVDVTFTINNLDF